MRGVQEVYIQSLLNDSRCLWPAQLFRNVKSVYVFDAEHVFEREMFTDGFESKEKYILILSPADESFVEGIYNRETGMALLNETLISTGRIPLTQIRQLGEGNSQKNVDPMTLYLRSKEKSFIQTAKEKLSLARSYNDGLRKIHDGALDEKIVKEMEDDLIHKIFKDKKGSNSHPYVDTAYFGTNAASGPLYITQFQSEIEHCYILKGQGTSVASKILSRIALAANTMGYDTCLYYCPFYTNEVDGIVIPELKTVVLDSEPPHQVEPLHPNECVITIGEKCQRTDMLFSHSLELRELEAKYKQFMRQAVLQLQDYRKYKRQEMNQSVKYRDWTIDKIVALLNG